MTDEPRPTPDDESGEGAQPLSGLRVLDISTIIAGPLAATLLAEFGAYVLKVELPGRGDALRALPPHKDGVALWWKAVNRNKQGMTLDLRKPAGKDIFMRLVAQFDVLVENFRPGTLERWGLAPEVLHEHNPGLTILRVSGFGQRGPYAPRPGFARIGDAASGFLSLCGEPDGPPMHCGYPLADTVTGLFGALGVLVALLHQRGQGGARGQVIDASLLESMFRMLDFLPIEYDQLGVVRGRSGNRNPYAAPGNVYRTRDGRWVSVAATTQSIFERLATAMARPDLVSDPRYATNVDRLENVEALDREIARWIGERDQASVCELLERHAVAAAPVSTIDELFRDPHVAAMGMLVNVPDADFGTVRMQGVVPRLSRTPGRLTATGPALGEHTEEILRERLGLDAESIAALAADGVI
ncbi:MAG: CoA transferase [Gammaproteobacteria bacterium]|nr:CoA transferase [Gammaproteobacteria bacterium]